MARSIDIAKGSDGRRHRPSGAHRGNVTRSDDGPSGPTDLRIDEGLRRSILLRTLDWLITVCVSWLFHEPLRCALAQAVHCMIDRTHGARLLEAIALGYDLRHSVGSGPSLFCD
jgi:hypothetical protein